MKKALMKDNLIQIKNTYKRFISILLMALLGVGFFAGIKATSPDMQNTLDCYFDSSNVMDIQVISTLGLTDNDIEAIQNIEGVEKVYGGYTKDSVVNSHEVDYVVNINSILDVNQVVLTSGNMPQNEKECVVEDNLLHNTDLKLGETIQIQNNDDFFHHKEMKVVGTIQSPLYISRERGTSSLGAGSIDYYIYMLPENIQSDAYSTSYVTLTGAKELSCFSEQYKEKVKNVTNQIEVISEERTQIRYHEIIDEANEKVEEAQQQLEEEKTKVDSQITEAEKKITEGKDEIVSSDKQIKKSEATLVNEIQKAKEQTKQAENTLIEKEAEYEAKKPEAINQLSSLKTKLEELNSQKTYLETQIQTLQLQYDNTTDENIKQNLQSQMNTLKQSLTLVTTGINSIQSGIEQINHGLETAETEIMQGKNKIESSKQELEKKEKEGYSQINQAKKQLEEAKTKIATSEQQLATQKQKAEDKISEAQKKINQAKDKVEEIKKCEWYILDRDTNAGYLSYSQDTERIANIAKVFPIVFFVVATLISLNSMTRMVEEQRVQIGTLKALGYNKLQIANKYIIYASSASIIGGVIGLVIGFNLLPSIIYSIYGMMYTMPPILLEFNIPYALIGLILAISCTVGATICSCIKELSSTPAELMRPKAPKPGKKVLLEKIPFLWSKLNFTWKVTLRNIFRYKKRFLMTIIGICGCTALILAGFGLRDSIANMIPSQYGEVFIYDMRIDIKEKTTVDVLENEINILTNTEEIQDIRKVNMQSMEVVKDNAKQDNVQLVVMDNNEKLNKYIKLQSRKTKEGYSLDDTSIIITEKLAKLLNVKTGDTVKLTNTEEKEVEVTVSHITENYIMHYIYMNQSLYTQLYGEKAPYNVLLAKTTNMTSEQEDNLSKELLNHDRISSVSFTSSTSSIFDDVMENMDYVVWILLVSAGLLAFVVLYNLSNVNISERIRELATIKVLGFYDKEVYTYISRETIILTIIGIILGLVAGYFLNMFMIQTCELDIMMFDKTVEPWSYIYAILITGVFASIVNIATYFSLKKIDMIESLKSVE